MLSTTSLSRLPILLLICSLKGISPVVGQKGEYKGCFKDDPANRQLPFNPNSPSASVSVEKCIDACSDAYYMYAALQGGKYCFCGVHYDGYGMSDNCTSLCANSMTQICGGPSANSVFITGVLVPGPPAELINISASDSSITIKWNPPKSVNGGVFQYKVFSELLYSFDNDQVHGQKSEWEFPNNTYMQTITGLVPGSQYNLSLGASSPYGDGPSIFRTFWTKIGKPEVPPEAQIIKKEGTKITVKLPVVKLKTGPTSAYQVIVFDEMGGVQLDPLRLTNATAALTHRIPFYIAAEISPQEANAPFTVGDGATYGNYVNSPLAEDKSYTVIVGIVSYLNGDTKVSYSNPASYQANFDIPPGNPQMNPSQLNPPGPMSNFDQQGTIIGQSIEGGVQIAPHSPESPPKSSSSALVTGLSVAIGIGVVLLIASVVMYVLIRRHYGHSRRRSSSDHQELTVHQSPPAEPNENGVASSVLYLNEEADLVDAYENLKERIWLIPRSHLDIGDRALGHGTFGPVHAGIAHLRSQQIPVLIQTTPAQAAMNDKDRRNMFNELDAILRLGTHSNVITFVGASEDQDVFHLAIEYYQVSLKDFLLESRALDHYPVYAEKQKRISTLKESQLLEVASGAARGMSHMSQHGVLHRHLTARNVVIVDGSIPKIAHFGLAQYDGLLEKYDYTRWMASEFLKNKVFTTKSDVWSFGVLLWELCTLGGTPYNTVRSKEVAMRVMRGMRLQQPKHVGDDLYQLMLQCWQIDLDERPTFVELTSILENMVTERDQTEYLHFDMYPGFQYERYELELELDVLGSHH